VALRDIYIRDEETPTQETTVTDPSLDEFRMLVHQKLEEAADQTEIQNLEKSDSHVRETGWTDEDSVLAAQRFFSSAALGWGDEAVIWTSSLLDSDEENSTQELYNKRKKEYDERQRSFAERNPKAAMAADIAGGFLTPAVALRAGTTLGRVGLSAAEGAIYGAGAAEEGERMSGLQSGAAFGAGGTAIFTLAGKAGSQLYRRRVDGDLVDIDGDFVPLTLASSKPDGVEGTIHTFYRDIVAPSFGGKGVIRSQEQKIIGKVDDLLESKKTFDKQLNAGLKEAEQKSKEAMTDALQKIRDELKESQGVVREAAGKKGASLQSKLSAFQSKKPEEIASKALKLTNDALDSSNLNFRQEVYARSLPAGATLEDLALVSSKQTPGEAAKEIDKLWNQVGYSMIKGKNIRFKKNELEQAIKERIEKSPFLQVDVISTDPVMKIFNRVVDDVQAFKDKNSRITGEKASEIRAELGSLAYRAPNDQVKFSLYGLQKELDEIIKSQLTPKQLKAFNLESDKWKTTVILRDAIEKTQTGSKRGAFDVSDWISSVSRNNKWDNRYAAGPLNQKARELEVDHKAIEKSIARRAKTVAMQKAKNIEKTIVAHNKELKSKLSRLTTENDQKKLRIRNNPQFAEDIARNSKQIEQTTSEIKAIEKELSKLNQLKASSNPGWFYTMAASGTLGGFMGGLIGGPLGIPAGVAGAYAAGQVGGRALAKPSVQKAIAGQLPSQQKIQQLIAADKTGRTVEALERAGGTIATRGMLTQ
jgi:hypothetical protein